MRPAPKRVTSRAANPMGKVLVLEYHRITPKEARWDRSRTAFRRDLERLYRMGFRPVTASAYLQDRMELPPGASPVVITFDDADPTQFRLKPDGTVDPGSGVGILRAFAERHPDFPAAATFFVLPNLWGTPRDGAKKAAMLREMGSELGSHTLTHSRLARLSDAEVQKELGGAVAMLRKLGHDGPVSIALPYGISPKNHALLKSGQTGGAGYQQIGSFLVGAGPAPSPQDPEFDPFRVPRIQAIEGDYGITDWLNRVEKGEVKPYVK